MTTADLAEKANKNKALVATTVFHVVALACALLFFKWTPPDPPLGGTGVELNFGVDEAGFGEIQGSGPARPNPNEVEAAPGKPNPQPDPVATNQTVPQSEPQPESPTTKDVLTGNEEESPVTAKPETKPAPASPRPEAPKTDSRATYKPGGGGSTGTGNAGAGNNNGDRPGAVGDQGDPRGTPDGRSLYGNPGRGGEGAGGGGNGINVSMVGWTPVSSRFKQDSSPESGRIVFVVKIDDQGEILSVTKKEANVSAAVVEFYKRQVEAMSFEKKTSNTDAAPVSTGTVSITIRAN